MTALLQTGAWKAGELFSIEQREPRMRKVTGEIAPETFNLEFRYNGVDDAMLRGGGIYAVHYRGELLYVGILTGKAKTKFGGNVAEERFWKHLEAQTMRGRSVGFTPNNYKLVCEMADHPLVESIRQNGALDGNGAVKSYPRKVAFAIKHRDEIKRIEKEPAVLDNFTFCYGRLSPDAYDPAISYQQLKNYLREIENRLILALAPPCNGTSHRTKADNLAFGPPAHHWHGLQEMTERYTREELL